MTISMQLFVSISCLFIYLFPCTTFIFIQINVHVHTANLLQTIFNVLVDFCCCELLEHICISTVKELFDVAENNLVNSS